MPEEQEWFKEILTRYVDAFRKFHKDGDNFTWWPNRKGFRQENKGYRFDYFLVSKSFSKTLTVYSKRPIRFGSCTYCVRIKFLSSMWHS